MAKVRFCKGDEVKLVYAKDRSGSSRMFHTGDDGEMQLFEVNLQPNLPVESHAHKESEIIFIMEGSMSFGAQVLRPGDSVQIDGMTLYAFKSGPEGVRFINFRARGDRTFYTRDELAEYNKLDPAAQAEMTERLIELRMKEFGYRD